MLAGKDRSRIACCAWIRRDRQGEGDFGNATATSRNEASAASRCSTISSASTSGGGRATWNGCWQQKRKSGTAAVSKACTGQRLNDCYVKVVGFRNSAMMHALRFW